MTALEAIMQAGGFDMGAAEVENVVVVRYKGTQRHAYTLNLKAALKGKVTEPFYLEPQDIVYVPRTKIAEINQWIDQHINKIIPDTGIFFRQTNGDTTIGVGTYR
jgi:protein involved in polysaccharide export with SLBB domain